MQFYQTLMGRAFFEGTMPVIKNQLVRLNENMEQANELKAKELQLKEKELFLMEQMMSMRQDQQV